MVMVYNNSEFYVKLYKNNRVYIIIYFPLFVECFEELDAGTGDDAIDSYYYDSNENRCFFFWFTGAGGNDNRYVHL